MKELLIIRSVSFQQLDLNLPEIIKKFPDYNISILTHEHGVELAKKYSEISNIYVYPYKGAFSHKNKVDELKNKHFDAVIVPVTNITGAGFLNVLGYGLTINGDQYYMCNVISDITKMSKSKIFFKRTSGIIRNVVSFIFTVPVMIIGTPFLLVKFRTLRKK